MNEKIIQITAGRGPTECMWVVTKLLKCFLLAAKELNIETKITDRVLGSQSNTLSSVIVLIKGDNITNFITEWEGSVLWIGKSPYRKYHKRKNWFVEINSFSIAGTKSLNVNEISFKTTKSSGPGGQHVNKTESAVWAVHKESGIRVFVQDSRSQHQNKKIAIERLNEAFLVHKLTVLKEQNKQQWERTTNIQRGNPTKTFEGEKFKIKR